MNQNEKMARRSYQSPMMSVAKLTGEDVVRTSEIGGSGEVGVKWDWTVNDNDFYGVKSAE